MAANYLNMNGYKTKNNKMYIYIDYEQENVAAASISSLLLNKFRGRQELDWWHTSSATMSKYSHAGRLQ